ncbi:MAG: hypothetical protein ABR568_00745 [Pyrinomonadaceae bacterium]
MSEHSQEQSKTEQMVISEQIFDGLSRYRSPEEIEHGRRREVLNREEARVVSEITAATQAGDIDALAQLLPRREAVALLLQELEKDGEIMKQVESAQREAERRREAAEAENRRTVAGNRAMALVHAKQLNEQWKGFVPLANNPANQGEIRERWAKAKSEYDRLVRENNLQQWEIESR